MITGLAVCTIALLPVALKSLHVMPKGEGVKELQGNKVQ